MDCCHQCIEPEHVDSEDIKQHYGSWQPPDEEKAAAKLRAEHVHHDFFDVWSCHVRDLKEFGIGHMMYFTFLWWMSALFCTLAVLVGVPTIAIYLAGKYYEKGQLELTTLGNFGRVAIAHNYDGPSSLVSTATGWELEHATAAAFMGDAASSPATSPFNKASAFMAASVIDCVGAIVYFIITMSLILLARRRAEDADTHTVTIHDYSVYVRKLPQDATSSELVEFFSQWGDVDSVEVVRAYGNMLRLVLQRGKLLQQLQSAIAALQKAAEVHAEVPVVLETACHKIKEKVTAVDEEIQAEQALGDTARVVGAFVTFRNESSKLATLAATPSSRIKQWWYLKPAQKLRGRYALLIKESPEPSDVQYENMEHSSWNRFVRRLVTMCCSYTALALGFFLISLASASRINVSRAAGVNQDDCNSCRMSVTGGLGLTDADKLLYAACDNTGTTPAGDACSSVEKQCYRCYCFSSLLSGRLSDSAYCSSAIGLLALQYVSEVGVVLAILVINMLLSLTSRRLTLFEKHHTRSSEARTLAHRLFLAQFLNSALSTIIANAHLPFLASLFDGTGLAGIFFQGIYADLTPNWYKVVGRSLLISQFVAAALRMVYLAMRWGTFWWAQRRRSACLSQDELENSMRGPEFLLDHRYGEHLSVIYVSMLLSGAMPVAYFSAAFWFVTSYWCDKLELLKLSRRPIIYGKALSENVMNLLPYAAVWHVAFALWAFSMFGVVESPLVTRVFREVISAACNGTERLWLSVTGISAQQLGQRLMSADAVHLLAAVVVMVGVLFLKLTLTKWIEAGRWLLNMLGLVADEEESHQTGAPEFHVAVRTQLLVGETSYAIQDNPAYAAAFSKMENMEEDMVVKVVLKGPSMKRRHTKGEQVHTPVQPLQQQQQQRPNSPRAGSVLHEQQPYSPPRSASTVAVAMSRPASVPTQLAEPSSAAGSSGTGQTGPQLGAAAAYAQLDDASTAGANGMQQYQAAGSRPGSNQGYIDPNRSNSGSRSGSRGVSRDAYPQISAEGVTPGGGFGAAAGMQQQQQTGDGRTWPPLPSSAGGLGLQQVAPQGQEFAAAQQYSNSNGGAQQWVGGPATQFTDPGSGAGQRRVSGGAPPPPPPAAPSVPLTTAQRFRQARANQVVPIPEEYLLPANMPENL